MKCPACSSASLRPSSLEANLACSACPDCLGSLLNLVAWRHWRDNHPEEMEAQPELEATQDAGESRRALMCPKCERIMLKFRFAADLDHGLDVCTHCEELWLDRGEWDYLKIRRIVGELPAVFTEPWQQRLTEERGQRMREAGWRDRLGTEVHEEAQRIHRWIWSQEEREALLIFLRQPDPNDN